MVETSKVTNSPCSSKTSITKALRRSNSPSDPFLFPDKYANMHGNMSNYQKNFFHPLINMCEKLLIEIHFTINNITSSFFLITLRVHSRKDFHLYLMGPYDHGNWKKD